MRNAHGFSAKQEKSCSLYGFSPSRFLLDAGLFFISLTSLTHCPFSVCRNSSAAMLLAEERELTENASLQREKRHRLPFHPSLFPPSPFFPLFPFLFHPFFPPFPPLLLPSLSSRRKQTNAFFRIESNASDPTASNPAFHTGAAHSIFRFCRDDFICLSPCHFMTLLSFF